MTVSTAIVIMPCLELRNVEQKTSQHTSKDYLLLHFIDSQGNYCVLCDKQIEHKSLLHIRHWYKIQALIEKGKYSSWTVQNLELVPPTTITLSDGSTMQINDPNQFIMPTKNSQKIVNEDWDSLINFD